MQARREHTRAELMQKLAPHGSTADIAAVLDLLQQAGLQSDARFAEAFVSSRSVRFGSLKLRYDLRARGVSEALVEQALGGAESDELARARDVWRRKFGAPPSDMRDYARQARFLQSRGFSADILKSILRRTEEE
ncbi:MAG: recombination regulator RecX [Rhodocyclaceae bacterium]